MLKRLAISRGRQSRRLKARNYPLDRDSVEISRFKSATFPAFAGICPLGADLEKKK